MPLHDIEKVSADRLMAIYRISESSGELLEELSPDKDDRCLLDSFSNDQKKKEWLAGRITLRYLAREYGLSYEGIRKDPLGKPYLRGHEVEISLSHSYPYVAAILDPDQDVGIDLEQPKEKLHRVAPRFLSISELEDAQNDIRKLCILWCAKEAIYKIYNTKGLIFRDNIFIEPFTRNQSGVLTTSINFRGQSDSYSIKYEDRSDFLIAFNE